MEPSGAERLVIVGAGGFGREVLDIVQAVNHIVARYDFLGFLDDHEPSAELLRRRNATWLGPTDVASTLEATYAIGIGNGAVRQQLDTRFASYGRTSTVLIHPAATIGGDVEIGDGVIIAAGGRVTTHVVLGRHSHLNLNTTVGHDSVLHDFVTVHPGATISGNVVLNRGVTVGTGANVLPGVTIGEGAFIGAGAVVTRDVRPYVTVVGAPAREIAAPTTK